MEGRGGNKEEVSRDGGKDIDGGGGRKGQDSNGEGPDDG